MGKTMRCCTLLLAFGFTGAPGAAADRALESSVVRTQAQWQAVIASGQKTPLDALTPYGKQAVSAMLTEAWTERGLTSLPASHMVRELNREQLRAVLAFLDSEKYLPMLAAQLHGASLRLPPPSDDVERDWQRLQGAYRAADSLRDASPDVASTTPLSSDAPVRTYFALFEARMREQALRGQPPGDLLLLFDAAAFTNTVSPGTPAFAHLLRVHRELTRRGIDTRRTLDETVLNAMLAAREFAQARAFSATRPHLAHRAAPDIVDTLGAGFVGRSVFDYDRTRHTLTRTALPAAGAIELVLVVNAGCQPSRRALDAIRSDAALRKRLQQANLTIIVPPAAAIPFAFVADWNAANPAVPMRIPFNRAEWASVDTQTVPTFYLLQGGRAVGEVQGWPEQGNRAALHAMLGKLAPDMVAGTSVQVWTNNKVGHKTMKLDTN